MNDPDEEFFDTSSAAALSVRCGDPAFVVAAVVEVERVAAAPVRQGLVRGQLNRLCPPSFSGDTCGSGDFECLPHQTCGVVDSHFSRIEPRFTALYLQISARAERKRPPKR